MIGIYTEADLDGKSKQHVREHQRTPKRTYASSAAGHEQGLDAD